MKSWTILGIVLIAVGGILLAYDAISYTTEEEVADIGPVEATVEETETIELPKAAGGIAIAGGVVLLVVGRVRN